MAPYYTGFLGIRRSNLYTDIGFQLGVNPGVIPLIQTVAVLATGLEIFIQSLPQGLEAWTGEHGLRLSAGERQ